MRSLLKYGISVLALTVGFSAANAQEEKRPQEQGQVERPDNGGDQKVQRQKGGEKAEKRESNDAMQGKGDGDRKEKMGQSEDRKDTKERMGDADRKDGKERMGKSDDDQNKKERMGKSDDRKDDGKNAEMKKDGQDSKRAEHSGKRHSREQVKNVQITKEKKTVIREKVFAHAPKRYKKNEINFSLSIGTAIPRSYVVYDIDPTFVQIVPEFEGYDYIVVGDVVLIIDPDTREIVDVVDV